MISICTPFPPGTPGILVFVSNATHRPRSTSTPPEHRSGAALPGPHPHGREEVISRVLDACESATPVVAITGPPGIGRSLVLARVRALLAEQQVTTAEVPLVRPENDVAHLVAWVADQIGLLDACGRTAPSLHRLCAALAARRDPVVVLVDDAHLISPEVFAALAGPVGALAGTRVTFVCAFPTPVDGPGPIAGSLRERGLLHEERLRPLRATEVERMLTDLLWSAPAPGTVARLRACCRGLPALVRAAVDGFARTGGLRVVDHHAHLVDQRIPRVPLTHPVFSGFDPESSSWSVVKALSLLHPLRGDVPGLIAASTGLEPDRVHEALTALRARGVLAPGPGWRLRVPMLATLITAYLGPYERSRTAQLAVQAVWSGTATCTDGDQLGERLADAGKLVDRDRAAAELLARGTEVAGRRPDFADRWLRTAVELCTDPADRIAALHRHATTCALLQRFASAAGSTELLLREPDRLSDRTRLEALLVHVVALAGAGGPAALEEFVAAPSPWADAAEWPVVRAVALCLLDRWRDAHTELTAVGELDALPFGRLVRRAAAARLGVDAPGAEPVEDGDVRRVLLRALLPAVERSWPQTTTAATIDASRAGRWDRALHQARLGIATAAVHGSAPGGTAALREMARILIARGQLNRARAVLADARSRHLLLPHLLVLPEAELESAVGDHQRARHLIAAGIAAAERQGVVAGTAELHLWLAEAEFVSGRLDAARNRAERIAAVGSRRHRLLARVLVHQDRDAAARLVALSRNGGRSRELAEALVAVAVAGLGAEKAFVEAYELYGELDALIPRARLRLLMRARKVTVPGRKATVAETERLLGVLIANGLTNSQVATVVGSSEKGVEARLTRLFQRTGYRSRAELTAATLSAEIASEVDAP
ncbi:hypothetical protein GCM10020366_68910 [Saccharopolyspora gregorii]|uniref:HTH luxR-type domain-containing protein n=1 Tax=Saccharopolyspora gregorii TaxID=33914 RepID=A0ABP6S2H4_9PSEU